MKQRTWQLLLVLLFVFLCGALTQAQVYAARISYVLTH